MTLDPLLAAARDPLGRPRFYPIGQHPATHRLRQRRAELEHVPGSWSDEAIAYIDNQLASFEEMESIAKADYLRVA